MGLETRLNIVYIESLMDQLLCEEDIDWPSYWRLSYVRSKLKGLRI